MNTNLLKEAIAEADAIKKMAIENAKASLNEAFDSKVKAMLAARLSEEAEGDDPDSELEEDYEEGYDDQDDTQNEAMDDENNPDKMEEGEDDPENQDEAFDLDEILAELEKSEKGEEDGGDEEYGMKEGEDEEDGGDEKYGMKEGGDEDEGEPVDEQIDIAELLAEMGDEEEEVKEAKHDDDDNDDHENDADKDEVAILEEEMMSLLEKIQEKKKAKLHKEKKMKEKPEAEELQGIKRQAAVLAQKVNETNLINAKLLYLNKILRKYNLSEQQKLKVISAFDKAGTTREAKIVHESLDQAFSVKNDNTKGSLKESIGFASKAAGTSTKRVINEGVITNADAQVSRWQKLAGIIK
jgi:hypothetical protein